MKALLRNTKWKVFVILFVSVWLQTDLVFAQKIRVITTIPLQLSGKNDMGGGTLFLSKRAPFVTQERAMGGP